MKKLDMFICIPCENALHKQTGAYHQVGTIYLPKVIQWAIRIWLRLKVKRNG